MNTLTRAYSMESAHRLLGHKGKCARLHGHNYLVELDVEAVGELREGMVIDAGDLDVWVRPVFARYDHRTLLEESDPLVAVLVADNPEHVKVLPYRPTAENIARHLWGALQFISNSGRHRLVEVRVHENASLLARWRG